SSRTVIGNFIAWCRIPVDLLGFVPHALRLFVIVGVTARRPLAFVGPAVWITLIVGSESIILNEVARMKLSNFRQAGRKRDGLQAFAFPVLHDHLVEQLFFAGKAYRLLFRSAIGRRQHA